ncbi:hypothetical protein JL108_11770 [Aeromicrobium sp. YIM 150415]|uniref:type IV toxin-antitoxin system AbiEi family antitoxin domain-containing protein n=1 Tax=Aeromicrobium sp. YIM 150415 TaxID=2803912 RepID=UPI00196403F6|nr:type IV toxin-antitoxin system AbiEi family antitoxin [Aeromicrobium sp. YIM 150415]MBM9464128.1 hypothetical protein [Aeromicrobium sp. YIM 150415]
MDSEGLPPAFTLADAEVRGLRKDQVYAMLSSGGIERVGRGVYLRPEAIDPAFAPLAAVTAVRPDATLCLTSALVHHGLSDAIAFDSDIAIPRGVRRSAGFAHIAWHSFDRATFTVGREHLQIAEHTTVAIYSPERTIVDCFRLIHREGDDVAHGALRRWLRRRGNSPSALMDVAAYFPPAESRLRRALEVLL